MKWVILVLFFSVVSLFAEVPNEITYSGRLREYGQPINGTRTMNFRFYTTLSGAGFAWETGDVEVKVSSGIFSYPLKPSVDWRGTTFYIETVVSGKTLSPREKITSQAYALHSRTAEDIEKSNGSTINFKIGSEIKSKINSNGEFSSFIGGTTYYMVPRGAIIIWSGTIANIPAGWQLCDGTNGSPDLTDRFILSVSAAENPGASGGAHSKTILASQLPAHSHYAISGNQSITHTHGMQHTHTYSGTTDSYDPPSNQASGGSISMSKAHTHSYSGSTNGVIGVTTNVSTTNEDVNHNHTISVNDSGQTRGSTIDFRPAYYKLAFIMKL